MAAVLRDFLTNLPAVHAEKGLRDMVTKKYQATGSSTQKRRAFEDVSNQRKNGRSQEKSKPGKSGDAATCKGDRSACQKVTRKVVTKCGDVKTKREKRVRTSVEKSANKSQKKSKIPLPVFPHEEFDATSQDLDELSDAIDNLLSDVPTDVQNIDEDHTNYLDCPTYISDILTYLRGLETVFQLPNDYLSEGSELKSSTRAVLVDWLLQVQTYLYLQTETLHLAIAIVDQFIARIGIKMSKLQLLGITALLIAAKYEERFAPDIEKLIHLTANTYTYSQVIKMEIVVLTTLKFELHMPTPSIFLNRYWKVIRGTQERVSYKMEWLCNYILDLGLTDINLTKTPASLRAAAAVYLANCITTMTEEDQSKNHEWSKAMGFYTTYTLAEIMPSVQKMAKLLLKAPHSKYQGAREKYSSKSLHGAISSWKRLENNHIIHRLGTEL